ncbi:mannose-6-phosphate isomerase, class I [Tessaracoccus caeni]|uniref:mannose-6-phosphate isomerase, class I n=1 Tax=Tessaracoccus caeni TaxID=3031239 RepID=UPI0023DBBF3E|nr:mannose-6-phosphate isomerase, class I [Tessaracoccus caeni]MDF1488229.1 mannose-6-phosphate isomerase, class I [Tessaracoccus caeni]
MRRLAGTVKHYTWGSPDALPRLMGEQPNGLPWAECRFGTHHTSEAALDDGTPLSRYLRDNPQLLGRSALEEFGPQLSYVLKLMAIETPLSLQAHPSRADAIKGYAKEALFGYALDHPERCYVDDWPKPELLVALTPFEGLVGFRDPVTTAGLFEGLGVANELSSIIGPLRDRVETLALEEVFLDVLTINRRRHLVDVVLAAAVEKLDAPGELGRFAKTAVDLDEHFPGDPGILAALLLNPISLQPGEGVAFPPGVMHAYLKGNAIEATGASDNTIRGGLTQKRIDVDGLIHVVDFRPSEPRILSPDGTDGAYLYPTTFAEFELWLICPAGTHSVEVPRADGARIAVATEGNFELSTDDEVLELRQGQAALLTAGEAVHAKGTGKLFVGASGT